MDFNLANSYEEKVLSKLMLVAILERKLMNKMKFLHEKFDPQAN